MYANVIPMRLPLEFLCAICGHSRRNVRWFVILSSETSLLFPIARSDYVLILFTIHSLFRLIEDANWFDCSKKFVRFDSVNGKWSEYLSDECRKKYSLDLLGVDATNLPLTSMDNMDWVSHRISSINSISNQW